MKLYTYTLSIVFLLAFLTNSNAQSNSTLSDSIKDALELDNSNDEDVVEEVIEEEAIKKIEEIKTNEDDSNKNMLDGKPSTDTALEKELESQEDKVSESIEELDVETVNENIDLESKEFDHEDRASEEELRQILNKLIENYKRFANLRDKNGVYSKAIRSQNAGLYDTNAKVFHDLKLGTTKIEDIDFKDYIVKESTYHGDIVFEFADVEDNLFDIEIDSNQKIEKEKYSENEENYEVNLDLIKTMYYYMDESVSGSKKYFKYKKPRKLNMQIVVNLYDKQRTALITQVNLKKPVVIPAVTEPTKPVNPNPHRPKPSIKKDMYLGADILYDILLNNLDKSANVSNQISLNQGLNFNANIDFLYAPLPSLKKLFIGTGIIYNQLSYNIDEDKYRLVFNDPLMKDNFNEELNEKYVDISNLKEEFNFRLVQIPIGLSYKFIDNVKFKAFFNARYTVTLSNLENMQNSSANLKYSAKYDNFGDGVLNLPSDLDDPLNEIVVKNGYGKEFLVNSEKNIELENNDFNAFTTSFKLLYNLSYTGNNYIAFNLGNTIYLGEFINPNSTNLSLEEIQNGNLYLGDNEDTFRIENYNNSISNALINKLRLNDLNFGIGYMVKF